MDEKNSDKGEKIVFYRSKNEEPIKEVAEQDKNDEFENESIRPVNNTFTDMSVPKKKISKSNFWRKSNIIKIGISALLVVVLVATLLVSCLGKSSNAASSNSSASENYDASEFQIKAEDYVGTVLEESEDAGIEYAEETLFLGDSNTNRMLYYYDITGVTTENGFGVDSMGITTFTTQNCATFTGKGDVTMPKVVEIMQPRRVVITFGTNNVGMNIDGFIEHYIRAIDAVQEAYSYADIIVASVFPVDEYRQNTSITTKAIDQMNQALAEMAKEKQVKFLNWGDAIRDEKTGYSTFDSTIQDGVHLTREGMERIFTYFRTHSYITQDERPMPLKEIPKRIATQPSLVNKDPGKAPGPVDWDKVESSSSSSSSSNAAVTVDFTVWDGTLCVAGGGTLTSGGSSGSFISLSAKPGSATAAVQANPNAEYEFVRWQCTVGSIGNNASSLLPGFTVPEYVTVSEKITVTAVFQKTAVSSSSSEAPSQPSSSVSSVPPELPSSSSAPQPELPSSSSAPQPEPQTPASE